jgi:branched-chain amino acid transport system ATP-binding protein
LFNLPRALTPATQAPYRRAGAARIGVGTETIIEATGLTRVFGGLVAIDGYSLRLAAGDLVGLIGPNGAGKTTAFNLLTGVLKPTAGRVHVDGADLTGARPHVLARAGVVRTFQNIRLFDDLRVLENVMCGGHMRHRAGLFATALRLPRFRRAEAGLVALARAIVDRLGLGVLAGRRAGDLGYGEQRRVEIARALASEPRVLLLDEPAAGLNPTETELLSETIGRINREVGVAVLVVEHDMGLVMKLCDRVQVLNRGRLVAEGTPAEVQADEAVIEAYLGTRRRHAAPA